MRAQAGRITAVTGANVLGALAFGWPFLAGTASMAANLARIAPFLFALALAVVLFLAIDALLRETTDPKPLALMAAIAAVAAASRPLGAGVAGLEPIWAVLIIGGRVLGPARGFVAGAMALLASAAFTGGVGPWLPYQMLVAAWIAAVPGLLPQWRGRAEILLLAGLGLVSGPFVGALLNLWFWPFAVGLSPEVSYLPGAGIDNVAQWLRYGLLTSMGFDAPRGLLTAGLVALATPALLPLLRRASRPAVFVAE